MNTNIRWVIYARKSSESEDKQVQSIPNQISYLKSLAEKQNLNVIEVISDEKSAKEPGIRLGFTRLTTLIEKGKADGILCWQLSRLARNPVDSGTIHWYLQKEKVKCIRTSEKDFLPEDNTLFFAVVQGMDNQYVRDLSKNVKWALYAKAERGWYPAIPMIGYLNSKTGEKGHGTIIDDPHRFPLVRKMWDLMLTGVYSPMDILRIATDEWKLTTPKRRRTGNRPIAISYIYKIFTSIFYTGSFYYSGKFYKGNHTPMVTLEEFDRVQILLKRKGNPKPIIHEFPFTGIIRCANCGSAITATEKRKWIKTTNEFRTYTYYHCTRRMGIDNCKEPPITSSALLTQVARLIDECGINPVFYEFALHTLKESEAEDICTNELIKQQKENHIESLRIKLQRLTTLLINDTISEDEYKRQRVDIDNEVSLEKVKLEQINSRPKSYDKQIENALHFCRVASYALATGDTLTRREVLKHFGSNHVLYQKNLCITVFGWFSLIKKTETAFMLKYGKFELEKHNKDKAKGLHFSFFPLLRALIEDVRTELMNSKEIPHIPDLSLWIEN